MKMILRFNHQNSTWKKSPLNPGNFWIEFFFWGGGFFTLPTWRLKGICQKSVETAAFSKLAWKKRIQQRYLVVALFAGHLVCVFRGAVSFLHHLCSHNPDNADSPPAKVCYTMEGKNSPYGVENTNQAFWLTLGVAEAAKIDSDGWMGTFLFGNCGRQPNQKLCWKLGRWLCLSFFS